MNNFQILLVILACSQIRAQSQILQLNQLLRKEQKRNSELHCALSRLRDEQCRNVANRLQRQEEEQSQNLQINGLLNRWKKDLKVFLAEKFREIIACCSEEARGRELGMAKTALQAPFSTQTTSQISQPTSKAASQVSWRKKTPIAPTDPTLSTASNALRVPNVPTVLPAPRVSNAPIVFAPNVSTVPTAPPDFGGSWMDDPSLRNNKKLFLNMLSLEAKKEQVLYIKRDGPDTTVIFCGKEPPLSFRMSLKRLGEYFPDKLQRVHRSYLVNVDMVSQILETASTVGRVKKKGFVLNSMAWTKRKLGWEKPILKNSRKNIPGGFNLPPKSVKKGVRLRQIRHRAAFNPNSPSRDSFASHRLRSQFTTFRLPP